MLRRVLLLAACSGLATAFIPRFPVAAPKTMIGSRTALGAVQKVDKRDPLPFLDFKDPQKDKFYALVFIDHTGDRIYRSTKLIGAEIHGMKLWDPTKPIDQQKYQEYRLDPDQLSIQPRMVTVDWEDFESGNDVLTTAADEETEEVKEDSYPIPDFDAIYEALKQCHRMHFGSRGAENNKRMRRIVRQLILKDENMAWEKIWFLHSVDDSEILPGSTPVVEQELTHQGILEGFAALIDNSDEEAKTYSGLTWEDVDDGIDGLDALIVQPPWNWFGEGKNVEYYDWGLEDNLKKAKA